MIIVTAVEYEDKPYFDMNKNRNNIEPAYALVKYSYFNDKTQTTMEENQRIPFKKMYNDLYDLQQNQSTDALHILTIIQPDQQTRPSRHDTARQTRQLRHDTAQQPRPSQQDEDQQQKLSLYYFKTFIQNHETFKNYPDRTFTHLKK